MRKILFFTTMFFYTSVAFCQTNQIELAEKATNDLVSTLQLNKTQTTVAQKIQERKYRNLSEIESLKESDLPLYLQKLQALEYGTDMSIIRMLNENKTQLAAYNKIRGERRLAKSKFQQKMKQEGKSAQEIEVEYWEERLAEF